jgi:hypothetical protein
MDHGLQFTVTGRDGGGMIDHAGDDFGTQSESLGELTLYPVVDAEQGTDPDQEAQLEPRKEEFAPQ